MMEYYGYELDRAISAERRTYKGKGEMSANEWRFNDYGSAEPAKCSFDTIFAAYTDFKQSMNWG